MADASLQANPTDSKENDGPHSSWKPNRYYVSKSRERMINELKKSRSSHKTFGLPRQTGVITGVAPPSAPNFQPTKNNVQGNDDGPKTRCSCNRRHPPVPKPWERPTRYPPNQNDYVRYNASHVEESASYHENRHEPRMVDGSDGHVMNLNNSGLVPQFVNKPNFGKIPSYLRQEEQQPQSHQTEPMVTIKSPKGTKHIPKEIKLSLNEEILSLQRRWIELDKKLGVVSFSRPDRREAIEDELLEIERRLQALTVTGTV